MVSDNLSPSNVIQVSIQGQPQGLAVPQINSIGLISSEQPAWYGSKDFETYIEPTSVARDFGSDSVAFAIANAIFSQSPNMISTGGYLAIIPRLQSVAIKADIQIQDINYQAIATGSSGNAITIAYTTGGTAGSEVVTVSVDAISVQIATGVSTAAQIAAAVNGYGAAAALVTATVFGTASNPQTAPVSATNLAGGSSSGLEPIQVAMIRTINEVYYFGTLIDVIPTTPFLTVPAYLQGIDKMLFVASNEKADFASDGIIGELAAKGQTNTRGLYYNDGVSQDTITFAAAYAGRGLSVDFSGSDTAITINMKTLIGFGPDTTLDQTDLDTCQANGIDLYPPFGFQGLTSVAKLFTSGANGFFDQIYNQFWMKFALQVAGFDFLSQTATKIPQTETGMDGLKNAYRSVMQDGVTNGVIAPGAWDSSTVFGNVANLYAAIAGIGYYVYSLPVAQQSMQDRDARKAPLVQIAAKMAGAIQSSTVIVQVNL